MTTTLQEITEQLGIDPEHLALMPLETVNKSDLSDVRLNYPKLGIKWVINPQSSLRIEGIGSIGPVVHHQDCPSFNAPMAEGTRYYTDREITKLWHADESTRQSIGYSLTGWCPMCASRKLDRR